MKSPTAFADLHAPVPRVSLPLPPAVRARLWLPGRVFGPADDQPRLWLILSDGRVLAFRLPSVALGDDRVIVPLVQAAADDERGLRWEVEHPSFGWTQFLYAAPVLPALNKAHAGFLFDADYRQFAACLDGQIMRLLLSLEREPTPPAITRRDGEPPHPLLRPYFASVRNYNRLAILPPETRARRLQGLARFPALLAPILLTEHRTPNVWDGKRHAWREKDLAVEKACDAGRDLTGALARHYGISRGLVRAPLNAAYWKVPHAAMRHGWLRLLDALPDNQRPTLAEFERWQPYLANYFALLGENDHGHPLPQPPEVHRGAFRLGWTRTWECAARRHGNLHPALADCGDFLRAARQRAAVLNGRPVGPSIRRLAAGWLACHGLLGLLAASERWHRLRGDWSHWQTDIRLPALIGVIEEEAGKRAEELVTPQMLAREGEAMRHCVASYWPQCLRGDRIFALRLSNGTRATAQYGLGAHPQDPHMLCYRLIQLRGPRNAEVDGAMTAWARRIEKQLNAPEICARLVEVVKVARFEYERHHDHLFWGNEHLEHQLQRVCAWLNLTPLPPETLLAAYVAGFDYHSGQRLEARLAPGQPLTLVREPDNPHDPLAVRIDWQNETLGYLPRRHNAAIARRLDAGEPLCARIEAIDPEAESWRRVLLVVMPART